MVGYRQIGTMKHGIMNHMSECKHHHLSLLPEQSERLRCRHCNLTIKAEELEAGYCPECFEISGKKRDDFEKMVSTHKTQYRCEACGIIIDYQEKERVPV